MKRDKLTLKDALKYLDYTNISIPIISKYGFWFVDKHNSSYQAYSDMDKRVFTVVLEGLNTSQMDNVEGFLEKNNKRMGASSNNYVYTKQTKLNVLFRLLYSVLYYITSTFLSRYFVAATLVVGFVYNRHITGYILLTYFFLIELINIHIAISANSFFTKKTLITSFYFLSLVAIITWLFLTTPSQLLSSFRWIFSIFY